MYRFRKQKLDLLILVEDIDIIKLHIHRFVEALTKVDPGYAVSMQSLYSQAYSGDAGTKCKKTIFVLNNAELHKKHAVKMCLQGNKSNHFLLTFGNICNEHYRDIFLPVNSATAASVDDVESWVPDLICFIFPKYRNNAGNKYYLENRSQSEQCSYRIETSMTKMGAVRENTYTEYCRCKLYILNINMSVTDEDIMMRESVTPNSVPTVVLVDAYTEISPEESERISQRVFSLLTMIHCILFLADNLLIHPDRFHSLRIGLSRLSQWCKGLKPVFARLIDRIEEGCKCCRIYLDIFGLSMFALGTGTPFWYHAHFTAWRADAYNSSVTMNFGLFHVCVSGGYFGCFFDCVSYATVPGSLITAQLMSILSSVLVFLGLVQTCALFCCCKCRSRKIATLSVLLEAFGGLASVLALVIFAARYRDLTVNNFLHSFDLCNPLKTAELRYISGNFSASFVLNVIATLVFFLNVTVKLKLPRCCFGVCDCCDRGCCCCCWIKNVHT